MENTTAFTARHADTRPALPAPVQSATITPNPVATTRNRLIMDLADFEDAIRFTNAQLARFTG